MLGFDDAAGFNGVGLHSRLADWIFLNQCLYFSKGIADFVVTTSFNEFMLPVEVPGMGSGLAPEIGSFQDVIELAMDVKRKRYFRARNPNPTLTLNDTNPNPNRLPRRGNHGQTWDFRKENCFGVRLQGFGVADPPDGFAFWGPGDNFWTKSMYTNPNPNSKSNSNSNLSFKFNLKPNPNSNPTLQFYFHQIMKITRANPYHNTIPKHNPYPNYAMLF